ncbi:MAG: hypothetical protein ACMXYG_03350 [Candidatus Woesearchaeota archaeon]
MKKEYYNKKSQISIFIILGVVVVLSIATGIVILMSDGSEVEVQVTQSRTLDIETIIRLVDGCIMKTRPLIKEIVSNGGELEISNGRLYNGRNYNLWCLQQGSGVCKNMVFSTEKLENELNMHLKPVIDSCLDFSEYEAMGYSFDIRSSNVETSVGKLDMYVYYYRTIIVTKEDHEMILSEFSHRFDLAIGRLYEVANYILNNEIRNNYFNKDLWMYDHGAEIRIEKHRPYPDTLYRLNKWNNQTQDWLQLHFGLQGVDTASDLSSYYNYIIPNSWCKQGNICFANPDTNMCSQPVMNPNDPAECPNPSDEFYPACVGSECMPCGDYAHGESWCEYDGLTGNGRDFVGTRHYVRSCINGYIFTEPCRDFREEICVSSGSEALCRPNRWKTCMDQQTQADCLDTTRRDCAWFDHAGMFDKSNFDGNDRVYCVPSVSPGFRFWNNGGTEVCQLGNEWMDCDGFSCPQHWVETGMLQCKRLGDCGYGYTLSGAMGNLSFFTTDLLDFPDGANISSLYGPETLGNYQPSLSMPPFNYAKQGHHTSSVFDCDDCTISHLLDRVLEYIDYLDSLDYNSLMLNYMFTGTLNVDTRHFNFCLPFRFEEEGNCNLCMDPFKPCTEYKCRSMGSNCKFMIDDEGYGTCIPIVNTQGNPPAVDVSTFISHDYGHTEPHIFSSDIFGLALADSVPPYARMRVTFNTTKPAQCTRSPIPVPISEIPFDLDFSSPTHESGLSIEHEFIIYALPSEYFRSEINRIANLSNLISIANYNTIEQQLDQIIDDFIDMASGVPGVSSSDIDTMVQQIELLRDYYDTDIAPAIQDFYDELSDSIQHYMISLSMDEIYVFFNCMDEYGIDSTDNFFFSFRIQEDHEPPYPIDINILNNLHGYNMIHLEVTMNEPVECKADFVGTYPFQDMNYDMTCSRRYFDIANGFKCSIDLPKDSAPCDPIQNTGTIYFKCRDQIFNPDISQVNVNLVAFSADYNCN